jgi:outer membrane cobalamin receptor
MNTQFRLSVLAAACLSATYSSIALAETSSKDETQTLATIVVTASREENRLAILLLQLAKSASKI